MTEVPYTQAKPRELETEHSNRPVAEEALDISGMYMDCRSGAVVAVVAVVAAAASFVTEAC